MEYSKGRWSVDHAEGVPIGDHTHRSLLHTDGMPVGCSSLIAKIEWNDNVVKDRETRIANANLMAAAPKMYEACVNSEKSLWLQIATMPDCRIKDELIANHEQIKEALSKAKGETIIRGM